MKKSNNIDSFILLRDMFIIPISFIKYTWSLLWNKQNMNIQQKVSSIDVGYFLISIIMIEIFLFFYINIYPYQIQINPIIFFNKFYVFLFFIINMLPLAILFALIGMLLIKKFTKKAFLLLANQVIKFFVITNIIIAVIVILGINELTINGRSLLIENDFKQIYHDHLILLTITLLTLIYSFFHILFLPLYKLIFKKSRIKAFFTAIVFFIFISILNQLLYQFFIFYPKIDTEKLINKKQFCKQVLDYEIDNNKTVEVNLTFQNYNKICKNL